jgi:phage terminase large subunit-like protein
MTLSTEVELDLDPSLGPVARDICRWIMLRCYVPEAALIGRPVKLEHWQQREIEKIYGNPHVTRRAILSFPRKNGKTTLAALLLLVHLCGPKRQPNAQIFSTAQSREQAGIIFELAAKIVRMSPILNDSIIVMPGSKQLICPEMGSKYRALSAEATTAFGLSPSLVIHDEIGQVRGPRWRLYEALETATGAQFSPLSILISTQASTDADLFSILIDDALRGGDPRTVVSLWTAPMDEDPFSVKTIRMANPAFDDFLNPNEVIAMAEAARRMPAREAEYRNLILNQRIEASSLFVKPALWKACAGTVADLKGREVYAGLDLSETADLTALVMMGKVDGVWHIAPTFWLPGQGLTEKANADHVPYDLWAKQGHLLTTPGASVSYEFVANFIKRELFEQNYKIKKIGFDRWGFRHLKPWLVQAGISEQVIEKTFVEVGQGTKTMSPALRDLEGLILERQLRHGSHPVMNMCAANAVIEGDDLGKDSSNRKLSKKRSSGRIDGMTALANACAVALSEPVIDISTLIA